MAQLWRMFLSLGVIMSQLSRVSLSRQFVPLFARDARSLRDTFPFNLGEADHDHHDHHDHHDNTADVADFFRDERQVWGKEVFFEMIDSAIQGGESVSSIPFSDVASSYAQGKR